MGVVAAIAAPVISGVISGGASSDAANAQVQAGAAANATQLQMLQMQEAQQQPWHDAGAAALKQLQTGIGSPETGAPGPLVKPFSMADMSNVMPAYQFALQQGTGAINNAADANGLHLSSGNIQNLGKYAAGLANQYETTAYDQYTNDQARQLNPLQSLAQVGQTSANVNTNSIGTAMGNIASNQIGMGNASAGGIIGSSNALTGGINSGINSGIQMNYLNSIFNPSSATTPIASPSSFDMSGFNVPSSGGSPAMFT